MEERGRAVTGRDDELYSRFLSGESEAYDELMILYGDSLTFYLNGYLHDWHTAEDLMIEAFSRIMVKRPKILRGGWKAYLFKTARRLAARYAAKLKRTYCFSLNDQEDDLPDPYLIESHVIAEEKKAILRLCLERIDPDFREALWLVYMEDLSYAAAAEVMGVSKKRVSNLLMRGKQHLRKELEKEGVTDAYE